MYTESEREVVKMDIHKEKCKKLKEIRKKVADKIGIDLHQSECTYEGPCSGTCPKCAMEEQRLNRALLGKAALATGVAAMSIGLAGCRQAETTLEGDIEVLSSTELQLEGEEQHKPDSESEEWNTTENMTTEKITTEATTTEEVIELEGDVVYVPETAGGVDE